MHVLTQVQIFLTHVHVQQTAILAEQVVPDALPLWDVIYNKIKQNNQTYPQKQSCYFHSISNHLELIQTHFYPHIGLTNVNIT